MPQMPSDAAIDQEIVALYREARAGTCADFKGWAMARIRRLLPLHSTHWVNGVMTDRGAVFHHVSTEGLRAGYWEHFQTLMPIDPVGPRMFANPGASMIIGKADFPARIRDEIMVAYGIQECVLGMAADATTGTFSVVCWYREPSQPPFTEGERQWHERLLPHWEEGLHLHRVGAVLRDLHASAAPGHQFALVEATGLIHYAQSGFGLLVTRAFPGWSGPALPPLLVAALDRHGAFDSAEVTVHWRAASQGLWMVHVRLTEEAGRGALDAAREDEVRALSRSLEERERELDAARVALVEREKREAVAQERARILRDLHDGVGAHLIGLRCLLQAGGAVSDDMVSALDGALDEMRLAIDSMQASEGDLGEVLAALRWRLQPRFEAAGVVLLWSMPDPGVTASACAGMGAGARVQVQRIVMEALTNVLKHSRARLVSVSFSVRSGHGQGWRLTIRDDGIGMEGRPEVGRPPVGLPALTPGGPLSGSAPGMGLSSMAQRAAAIGAGLELLTGEAAGAARGVGTELRLSWPGPGRTASP